jgi:hypothetical protein
MTNMITAGNTKELASSVLNLADNSPKISGTVYIIAWIEDDANGYEGKFWDGSTWTATPASSERQYAPSDLHPLSDA